MEIEDNIPLPAKRAALECGQLPLPETHTIAQAMTALNMGRSSIYRLFAQQELTPMKIGTKTLVLGLREFIERKATEARQLRAAS